MRQERIGRTSEEERGTCRKTLEVRDSVDHMKEVGCKVL